MNAGGDMSLTRRKRIHAETLCPGMRIDAVVLLPLAAITVCNGITATVHSIQIGITLGWFQEISVAVGSCRRKRIRLHLRIMVAIPVEAFGRLFPRREKSLVIERSHLVDTAVSLIRLHSARVLMRYEEPLEMAADAVPGTLCQHRLLAEKRYKGIFGIGF